MEFVRYNVPREVSIEMFFIRVYTLGNLYKYDRDWLLTGGNIFKHNINFGRVKEDIFSFLIDY